MLSVVEDRALSAVQALIDQVMTHDRMPVMLPRGFETHPMILPRVKALPEVRVTWDAYEKMFGLTLKQRRANGAARQHARDALLSLAGAGNDQDRFFGVTEHARRAGRTVPVHHELSRLFLIKELTADLMDDPLAAGARLPEPFTIIPSPFLIDGVPLRKPRSKTKAGSMFVLKPNNLHQEIGRALRLESFGGHASNRRIELHLLLSKLMTRAERNYSPSVEKALQFLCLDGKGSKPEQLERLQLALDIAHHLEFLEEPAVIRAQQLKLKLNPNRIPKLNLKKPQTQ